MDAARVNMVPSGNSGIGSNDSTRSALVTYVAPLLMVTVTV